MHAAIWSETEVNWRHQAAALYIMAHKQCSTWWHRCQCCPRVGHLEVCPLQPLVLRLFANVRFHSTSLLHQQSAIEKCSTSLLTLSSYSDLDYQVWSHVFAHCYVSAVFDLAAVCNSVLLLTVCHLRIRVSLVFDNMNNVAWVHVKGLNPRLWKKLITFKLQKINQEDKIIMCA